MFGFLGLSLLAIASTGSAIRLGAGEALQAVDNVDNGDAELCPYQADIMLLMDASSSIGPQHYEEMKDFLRGVISNFDIDQDKVRVGLITFNFGAKIEFHLNQYNSKRDIISAFDNIQGTRMGTATHRSMQMARAIAFTPEHGDRPGVPNIAIVITDGQSTHPDKTTVEQELLKQTGVRIFAIGIGWVNKDELHRIASDPQEKYFHYVQHFDGLQDILSEFQKTSCSEITRPPPSAIVHPPVTPEPTLAPTQAPVTSGPVQSQQAIKNAPLCPYAADIFFLIDASSSIGPLDYNRTKDFAKGVIEHFDIGPNATRVGVITFNFGAKVEFLLNKYDTKVEILAAFDHLQDVQIGTATNKALKFAREQGFIVENGDRPELPNIAILVTDGKATHPNLTIDEQRLLKDTGVRIFAIGIGWIDEDELRLIASDPVEKYYHHVHDFHGLDQILDDFKQTSCNEITRPPPSTTPTPSTPVPTTTQEIVCPYQADIMLLMDASSSIGPVDYALMKDFLKQIIGHFDIGPDTAQVGVITFNFGAQIEFDMNKYHTKAEIFSALDSVQNIHVGTATHKALKYARETSFTVAHGERPDVPNIAILITDGRSTHPNLTADEQALLKQAGVRIFAIGIGWANRDELNMIASDPKEKYFHYVNEFTGLADIISDFKHTSCAEITRTVPPVQTTAAVRKFVQVEEKTTVVPIKDLTTKAAETVEFIRNNAATKEVCLSKGDVVFLLDTSSSVDYAGLNKTRHFVLEMISEFDIGPDNVHVAVVTFDQFSRIEFNLDTFTDLANMTAAINEIINVTVGTNTHKGLEMVRTQVFNTSADREHIDNIAIVITDGRSRLPNDTAMEAELLKATGAKVFAIGVGWVDHDEIDTIASSHEYAFHIDDFDALAAIKDEVLNKTCDYCHIADIIFVMDASSSIGVEDYQVIKDFVKDQILQFVIGEERVQFGLVTFNQFPRVEFHLNAFYNHFDMFTAIDNAKEVAVGTWTDRAIKTARETMLIKENGARDYAPDLMIVITDGFSREPDQTKIEADLCKEQNVTMFSLGIGKWTSTDELRAIASSDEYMFSVAGFDGLDAIKDLLAEKTCDATATPWPVGCNIEADIMFVFDSSSGMSYRDFERAKDMAMEIVANVRLAKNRARIGVVKFNDDSILEFRLDYSFDKTTAIEAIRAIEHTGAGSRPEKALYELRTVAFKECLGGRDAVPDVAIVFTNGKFQNHFLVTTAANMADIDGIRVYGVGVGDNVDATGVSLLSPTYVRHLTYFSGVTHKQLGRTASELTTRICQVYSPCDHW